MTNPILDVNLFFILIKALGIIGQVAKKHQRRLRSCTLNTWYRILCYLLLVFSDQYSTFSTLQPRQF